MFSVVICVITTSALPADLELSLLDSVLDPEEAHVHGLGALSLDGVVGDSCCYLVVGDDCGGYALGVPHFGEDCSYSRSFLAVVEEAGGF